MMNSAILLAAGKGTRYKGKKQDVIFCGRPLWEYVFETLSKVVNKDRIAIVGKDVPGGETRTESVINGLKSLPGDTDRVVIVEAVRPLVTEEQIRILLDDKSPSTTFVRPLVNTVIFRNGQYINRDELYDMLTPQAFDYKMLYEAYMSNKFYDMTDETRAMYEFHGIKPHLIETDNNLFKVTYPGDMSIIESLYEEYNLRREKTK